MTWQDVLVVHTRRLQNTASGNPKWRVQIQDQRGEVRNLLTAPDAADAYKITGFEHAAQIVVEDGRIVRFQPITWLTSS